MADCHVAGEDWTRVSASPTASWMRNEACMMGEREGRKGRGGMRKSGVVGFEERGKGWGEEEERSGKVWRVEKAINL